MGADPMRESRPVVEERSSGVCELCGVARATDKHHRKLRRHGDHKPANLLDLCHVCHMWAHNNVAKAREVGVIVASYLDPREVLVKHAQLGWVHLDDHGGARP